MEVIDVTPNPRILQMLGQIAFEPWQCIAELVDNSIDAYLSAIESNPNYLVDSGLGSYGIFVNLPNQQDFENGHGLISIMDNGPGMDLSSVNDSVRAGFSGNDPLNKLGLFGMGFNIATARLGKLTKIKTARRDDDHWLVVTLDLEEMRKTGKFSATVKRNLKDPEHLRAHGTVVEIHKLKSQFQGNLTSGGGRAAIKRQLARIYSNLLTNHPITMQFGGNEIVPWKHCNWDPSRTAIVASGSERPCYLKIDHNLPDNYFCNVCWNWSDKEVVQNEKCPACSSKVSLKTRRIHGWLGVQRFFDSDHFGIDLIRNGRVIEQLNKDLFTWIDEAGQPVVEYPIDTLHWGGRLIGQINIDFAAVDYQKTSFEKQLKEWHEIRDYLRGTTPFRPREAIKLGYETNDSPLGRLWSTFRSGNTPGRKKLVPGKKESPGRGDNSDSSMWAQRFFKGEEEFQSDELWWERVLMSERYLRGSDDSETEDGSDSFEDPFDDEEEVDSPEGSERSPITTTKDDASAKNFDKLDRELSLNYEFPDPNVSIAPITLNVFEDTRELKRVELQTLPPLSIDSSNAPHRYTIKYHKKHPAFIEFSETVDDYILMELASWFSLRQGGGEWSVNKVYQKLKQRYQESRKLDLRSLGDDAALLLSELKQHLSSCGLKRARNEVSEEVLKQLEDDVMATSGDIQDVDKNLLSGKWIECVTDEIALQVIIEDPACILDGKFFKTSYANIVNEDVKKDAYERILSCLRDIIMIKKISERQSSPEKQLLIRANGAITYLNNQRA